MLFQKDTYGAIKKRIMEEDKKATNASSTVPNFVNEKKLSKDVEFIMKKFTSVETGQTNKILKEYITAIQITKGDYTRRSPRIIDKVEYMVSFVSDLISTDSNVQFSCLGLYVRTWKLLTSPFFINVMKKVYDATLKEATKDIANLYLMLYFCLAYYLETMTVYLVKYEMLYTNGKTPEQIAMELTQEHKGFSNNITMGIATILPFLEKQKVTGSILSSIEKKRQLFEAKKESEKIASEAVGTATAIMIASAVIISALVSAVLLYALRNMFYWMSNAEIASARDLEIDAEFLKNNIRALKKEYETTNDPVRKKKLKDIIAKQEAVVIDWDAKIRKTLGDESKATYETEEEIAEEDQIQPGQADAKDIGDVFL